MQKFPFPSIPYPETAKKSANNRIHAKHVKYSNFYNIFTVVLPILMKFRMAKHTRLRRLMSVQKF